MLADARGQLKEKLSANSSYTDPVHRAGLSELELYLINSLTFITNMLLLTCSKHVPIMLRYGRGRREKSSRSEALGGDCGLSELALYLINSLTFATNVLLYICSRVPIKLRYGRGRRSGERTSGSAGSQNDTLSVPIMLRMSGDGQGEVECKLQMCDGRGRVDYRNFADGE